MATQKLVIVGGGPSGCACAIEAAALGLEVVLIDEHPQALTAMSFDAPYFYGSRLPPQLSDASAVADAVLGANEPLMEALEAGVDVLTSTCAWGVFGPDSGDPATRGRQVGLADQERSWILDYDHLVLAPGARDLVLSFPKWDLPGVLGLKGATALLGRYGALGGGRVLILGSGTAALAFARDALATGIEVAGIVEAGDEVVGPAALAEELRQQNITLYLSHAIREARGVTQVEGATLVPVASDGSMGSEVEIACDTICMAFGAVPNIELASVAGCAMTFDPLRGGWVPQVGPDQETSVEGIYVVGDGAGVLPATLLDDALLLEQGRRAARAIARRAGLADAEGPDETSLPQTGAVEANYPPERWLTSLLALSGEDVIICQCEEVTRRELVGVVPPRYLNASDRAPAGGLASMGEGSRRSQDAVKRMTRVGMGHCQGRRCRDQGAMLLARASGILVSEVSPGSYRVPVRPLPVDLLSAEEESPEMRDRWPYWLWEVEGIPEKAE
jgi:NADPH-dependent 2,4-dienoyl-CoA reductase/sulfur reductase-like enzyme